MTGRSARPAGLPCGRPGVAAAENANPVVALFDGKAAAWPGKYGPDGALLDRLSQFATAVTARVPVGGAVLDLGCGTGELARRLAADGYQATGCDIAPLMLLQATAADPGGTVSWLPLEPGWQALPFEAQSLDGVTAASVLEYAPDPSAVLRECARVLRPDGTLICTVPDVTHVVRWLEWPLATAARVTGARAAAALARVSPRLGGYVVYLRVSRQRRSARWWRAAARQAGFLAVPGGRPGRRAPLLMLTFVRAAAAPVRPGHRKVRR